MTKAELVDAMYNKLEQKELMQDKVENISEWMKLDNDSYNECKELCKSNGITGEAFYALWDKATDKFARKNNIVPELPLYRKA